MTADAEGNDIGAVRVPVTGFVAVQLTGGPTYVGSAAGAATPLALPAGYEKLGLIKVDGGPQDSADDGDAIEFWQRGYKLAGDSTLSTQVSVAETNPLVRRLVTGKTPDVNGMIVVDRNIPDITFPLFQVTKFKDGSSRRRNGLARISAVEVDQETRGEVAGRALTFEWILDDTVGGFFREWIIPATAAAGAKTSWDVTISGTPTGGTFSLLVNGLSTAPIAYNAAAAAITSALNGLSGVTGITGISTSGTGPFTVTLPTAATLSATSSLTGGTAPTVTVA